MPGSPHYKKNASDNQEPVKFKIGDVVRPTASCKFERNKILKVLGPSVRDRYGMRWTPVDDPDEQDPTFFKTYLLEKVE